MRTASSARRRNQSSKSLPNPSPRLSLKKPRLSLKKNVAEIRERTDAGERHPRGATLVQHQPRQLRQQYHRARSKRTPPALPPWPRVGNDQANTDQKQYPSHQRELTHRNETFSPRLP